MKKTGFLNLKITILIFSIILGTSVSVAQTTTAPTSTDPDPYGGLTREQYIEAEKKKYIEAITPKNNPYSNLSAEEYSKLPLSAKMPNDIKEQISIDISPENPRPGESVTITASAYGGVDMNTSNINWLVDGVSTLRGVGKKSFTFTAASGKRTTVDLRIQPQYGPTIARTFKFNPSAVDILWQADTYTPPFYKGKALYTPQADVQFVSMPDITRRNGSKLQPNNSVYKWELDYTADAANSGYGVNSYKYSGSILGKPTTVNVTAYDPSDSSSVGVGTLELENIQPIVLLYETHPTYGTLFNTAAIGAFNFGSDDIELGAYPYFYSASRKNNPKYTWKINGAPITGLSDRQDFIVLQKLSKEEGQSTISVDVSNGDKVLQQAKTSIELLY